MTTGKFAIEADSSDISAELEAATVSAGRLLHALAGQRAPRCSSSSMCFPD